MRTSGTGNGAMPDCLVAPCIRRAAARLLVMAVTPGSRHEACGLLGGTALEGHRTFSLLPDFLAVGLSGLLAAVDDSITVATSAKSMEAAADALRGPDVTLPSAVRWLRRRIRAVRTALAHVTPEMVVGAPARESAPQIDPDKGRVLLGLRRSLSPQILNSIPAPLGFRPASGTGWPRDSNDQHEMGPDRQVAGHYGPVIYGNQVRWNIRPDNTPSRLHQAPKICSGSGAPIAPCKTAAPAFTCNGSSASASIVHDANWMGHLLADIVRTNSRGITGGVR